MSRCLPVINICSISVRLRTPCGSAAQSKTRQTPMVDFGFLSVTSIRSRSAPSVLNLQSVAVIIPPEGIIPNQSGFSSLSAVSVRAVVAVSLPFYDLSGRHPLSEKCFRHSPTTSINPEEFLSLVGPSSFRFRFSPHLLLYGN